jgi:hypothetical protein
MNLKEFLFYSGINARVLASELGLSHTHIRNVLSGRCSVSKQFAVCLELYTKGIVKKENVMGPFTHQDYEKVLEWISQHGR